MSTAFAWDAAFDTMSLADLSVLSGISLPALSQYKSGAKPMSSTTHTRVAIAAAAGPDSVILAHGLSSFPSMGAVVKKEHSPDPSWCISVLAQGIQQAATHLTSDSDIEAFHNMPVHIAHPGWRALLHGAALLSWQQFKSGKPWWVQVIGPQAPWSPFDHGKYFSEVWKSTPVALKQMNVVIGDGLVKAL